ncbi:MAG: hypothetical protein K2J67_05205 [Lachnospiraceae bacterium]|nr:hypothetical protein [Lachnospiraceae bacterium]
MTKRMICLGVLISILCTSCGRLGTDVSSGDEVVISKALQDPKNTDSGFHVAKGIGQLEIPSFTDIPDVQEASSRAESPLPSETACPTPTASSSGKSSAGYEQIISHDKVKIYDSTGTAVIGDTGYEIYNYVSSAAETYAKTINRAGSQLGKSYHIYTMVAPTSVGITVPDNKVDKINSSDQQKAIQNIYKKIKKPVQKIELYDTMMRHRKEYIYFRTDHHWSALGAYYAYRQFCENTERIPYELSQYHKKSFGSFIGTFYGDSDKNENLRKDKLEVYYPQSKLTMQTRSEQGRMVSSQVIEDGSGYGISAKYSAFLGGDHAYSIITNKEVRDDSACIVVKESYGNAFVPFLADHYHKVYVVDYRYWTGKLSDLAKQKKVQDILFVNNISMTRNLYLIGKLSQILH